MSTQHVITRLSLLSILALATACNPLVYGELIDHAPVRPFALNAPISGNPYGSEVLRIPGNGGDGRILMLGDGIPVISDMRISPGYDVLSSHPTGMQLNDLFRPLMDLDSSNFGGLDIIPNQSGGTDLHAVIGVTSSFDATTARVFMANIDTWARVSEPEFDMIAPVINNNAIIGFGQDVQATNLDASQSDAAYEVAVGSAEGIIIFDALGANVAQYKQNREDILAVDGTSFDDENAPQGYWFTLCDELNGYHRIGRGPVGPGGSEVFLVSTAAGITMIGDQPVTNQVGAPVFDCAADFIANPGGSTDGFGRDLFVDDLNGDGNADLFVGDPSTNTVYLYLGVADGLPSEPSQVFTPPSGTPAVLEFGHSIDRADLGGGYGTGIVITAPGSAVGGSSESGIVFVYRVNDSGVIEVNAEPTVLEDLTPDFKTRYGLWAGGIYNEELGRDELMVIGNLAGEGRIHTSIDGLDPN